MNYASSGQLVIGDDVDGVRSRSRSGDVFGLGAPVHFLQRVVMCGEHLLELDSIGIDIGVIELVS